MARALDPVVAETLKKYGFGKDAVWDCHGVWVVYHRTLEMIAAQAGIAFDPPQIIEAKGEHGIAAVCVVGRMGDKAIWSIGEAAPKNNKNAYPWAMAEKRAVDRVILKLIGIHGLAYSEEEADDFKETGTPKDPVMAAIGDAVGKPEPPKKKDPIQPWRGPLKKTALQDQLKKLTFDLTLCQDMSMLTSCLSGYQGIVEQVKADMPGWWDGEAHDGFTPLKQRIEDRESLLSQDPSRFLKAG
jgi:hypothetical protein